MDDLDQKMRRVLLGLALTSNGRTASYNPSGGGGDHQPPLELRPGDAPHDDFLDLYARAADDRQREEVLHDAEAQLRAIRVARGPKAGAWETQAQRDARIVEQGEGWPALEVARAIHCGINDVRRARARAGRDTEFGRLPRNGRALDEPDRRADVLRMASEGSTERQIAFALGLERTMVRRILGRKA